MLLIRQNGHYRMVTEDKDVEIDPYGWAAMEIDYDYIGEFDE